MNKYEFKNYDLVNWVFRFLYRKTRKIDITLIEIIRGDLYITADLLFSEKRLSIPIICIKNVNNYSTSELECIIMSNLLKAILDIFLE